MLCIHEKVLCVTVVNTSTYVEVGNNNNWGNIIMLEIKEFVGNKPRQVNEPIKGKSNKITIAKPTAKKRGEK